MVPKRAFRLQIIESLKMSRPPSLLQNLGFFGDMVLSVLNGMMNAGGEYDDSLYLTAKVKVR